MSVRFYSDAIRCAIFEEAPGGGDPLNPNSAMNRPILAPMSWLPNIRFHSELNYYGIAAKNMNAVINHAAVAGMVRNAGDNGGDAGNSIVSYFGQGITRTHLLLTHNLGYVPRFFCVYNNRMLPQGIPIQNQDNGRVRFVTAYATTTQIRLFEIGYSTNNALAAATRTYQVMAFRTPAKDPALQMLDMSPGSVVFGQGKFRATEPHLRAYNSQGDTAFAIARGRTAAIGNGGIRAYTPNGGFIDFNGYSGNLTAPAFINVSAGV